MNEILKDLHELCEMYGEWIHEAKDKLRKSGTSISPADADFLDKLTHSLKSIKTTVAMMESEDDGGYSNHYPMVYGRTYADGRSYAGGNRGGRSYNSYEGNSYAQRRDSMGRYSSENGYSYADSIDSLIEEMRGMMGQLPEEKRREVQRFVDKMDRM